MGIYTHRYTCENQVYLIDECQKNLSALVRTEQISKQLNLLSFKTNDRFCLEFLIEVY